MGRKEIFKSEDTGSWTERERERLGERLKGEMDWEGRVGLTEAESGKLLGEGERTQEDGWNELRREGRGRDRKISR